MKKQEKQAPVAQHRVDSIAGALEDVIQAAQQFDDMRAHGPRGSSMILDESELIDGLVYELRHCIDCATPKAVGIGWFLRFGMSRPGQFETQLRLRLQEMRDTCGLIDRANQRDRRQLAVSVSQWPLDRIERALEVLVAVAVPPREEDGPPADLINHERAAEIAGCSASTIRRWLGADKLVGYDPNRQVSESDLRERLPQLRERAPRTKKGKRA